jgi:hypothetical protein
MTKEKIERNTEIVDKFHRSRYANFQKFLDAHPELFNHPESQESEESENEEK